jgi:hypothetical protein
VALCKDFLEPLVLTLWLPTPRNQSHKALTIDEEGCRRFFTAVIVDKKRPHHTSVFLCSMQPEK